MEKLQLLPAAHLAAKIEADKENRAIRDGEIVDACQQACPAQAISFGNINDKQSKVARLQADERSLPGARRSEYASADKVCGCGVESESGVAGWAGGASGEWLM